MTRQAARELAPHRTRVNCIATQARQANRRSKSRSAALFLCSDAAQSLNGQVLTAGDDGAFAGWLVAATE